jgi:sirohydrochlorin ferrochelatase
VSPRDTVLLVARGSADPRAGAAVAALARAVGAARPGLRVRPAYLEHEVPALGAALTREAGLGLRRAVLVPLLLTAGYHAGVRLAAQLGRPTHGPTVPVLVTPVLGPADAEEDRTVRDALVATLAHLLAPGADAVVVAASGTRASRALRGVELVAAGLARCTGLACRIGYVTGGGPGVGAAVGAARAGGAARVAVAAYLLSWGSYHDFVVAQAIAAGAMAVAQPLTGAPSLLAHTVLARLDAVRPAT